MIDGGVHGRLHSLGMFILDWCIYGSNCINIPVSKLRPGSAAKERPQRPITPCLPRPTSAAQKSMIPTDMFLHSQRGIS